MERSTLDCAAAVRDCQYFSPSPGERFQPFEVSFVGDIFTQTLPFHLEQQSGAVKKAEIRLKLDTSRANLQFFESASSWKSSNFEGVGVRSYKFLGTFSPDQASLSGTFITFTCSGKEVRRCVDLR